MTLATRAPSAWWCHLAVPALLGAAILAGAAAADAAAGEPAPEPAAQSAGPPAPGEEPRRLQDVYRLPPRYVTISNMELVPDTWVVHDFELFFGHCYQDKRILMLPAMVIASGVHKEYPTATKFKAIDGNSGTNWTAQCKAAMGGCTPYEAYIGADLSSTAEFAAASQINVTDEVWDAYKVKCVRFFQSVSPRERTGLIVLREGSEFGEDVIFTDVMILEDCAGGIWSRRPAWEDTLWRVSNLEQTVARWGISELQLYEDVLCQWPHRGIGSFSSGSTNPEFQGEYFAFDGNLTTKWVARCQFQGCYPQEVYLGIDLGEVPRPVRCMRVYQATHDVNAFVAEKPSFTTGFALDRWDGMKWVMVERFWDPKWLPNVAQDMLQTLDAPFLGGGPGIWEDTRPENRSAWRLANDDYTAGAWRVDEMEFYRHEACQGLSLFGEPVSMQGPRGFTQAIYGFDGSTAQDPERQWASSCAGAGGRCVPQEAWLGIYIRGRAPHVRCFRLFQAHSQLHQARSVELSMWSDGRWVRHSIHRYIGGGGWNRRPAPPWTMWRVSSLEPIPAQWRVVELRGYSDPFCLFELDRGYPIASGYLNLNDDFSRAWDDQFKTMWGADCDPCNFTSVTKKLWLGMEMPVASAAKTNVSTIDFLRCFRIWQSPKYEEQAQLLRTHIWDGQEWVISGAIPDVPGGGGGTWSRHPANYMSKWRLRPELPRDGFWRLEELELYSSRDCLPGTRLRMPWKGQGGSHVTLSGYHPELLHNKLIEVLSKYTGDDIFSEGRRGMDGDPETSARLVHQPSAGNHAWFGVDYLSEVTWVRCVRVRQGPFREEQALALHLETWNGKDWSSDDRELSGQSLRLTGLGGSTWDRRPAADGTIWRLENLAPIGEGWSVYEVELHGTFACAAAPGGSSLIEGEVVASGYAPHKHHNNRPAMAFDGKKDTAWVSQCSSVHEDLLPAGMGPLPVGCSPGDAWIGLDVGLQPQEVRCVRIYQVGYRHMQSSSVGVSKWDGSRWSLQWRLDGLGGNTWNQRPAMANTMWRILQQKAKIERCPGQMFRIYNRSWGITELGFYSDDDCTQKIPGGRPIGSGTVEKFVPSIIDHGSYAMDNAFDGLESTVWAANCLLGWRDAHSQQVDCQHEWLGLDFVDTAVEVRCVKLQHARLETPTCCDMADDVELQRWNGSAWAEASWRHEPGPGGREDYRWMGAQFRTMGECPERSYTGDYKDAKVWQTRGRRDSENCLVPLSTGITLLAEPFCVEHPRCAFAFGEQGRCCPVGDGSSAESRCCCNYLTGFQTHEPIFIDEEDTNQARASLAVEYAVVRVSDFLPFVGAGLTTLLYILALAMPEDSLVRMGRWVGEKPRWWRKGISMVAWPVLTWRHFLWKSQSFAALACRWCCLPNNQRPGPIQMPRYFLFVVAGTLIVGVLPWLGFGLVVGWILLKCSLALCLVVRWTKSRYDPKNPWDMRFRQAATHEPLLGDGDTADAIHVAADFVAFVILAFMYFLKFSFDLLLARAQMLSYDDAINPIAAERVIDIFPGLMRMLQQPARITYYTMYHAGQLVSYTIGIVVGLPRCEGATALISCVALVLVLVTVTQWLNYDFFGLFAAGCQAVKTTKPACQRILLQGGIMLSLSIVFGTIQCTMVLFSRALSMANPFKHQVWICEWSDVFALYLGRGLLVMTSVVGSVFVFLCVNGHFMGQDYIIKPVGRFLGLNFDALDPDGAGAGGGLVRVNTVFSAVPTICGVWFDWWNVDAFLVQERARVYAEQLGDPQPCLRCRQIHVKYSSMMCAAGRQIGLACQLLPYGILIGKACEYFNDPPLCYCGTRLECFRVVSTTAEPRPVLGKNKCGLRMLLLAADVCTFTMEWGVPFLRRLVAIGMYVVLLIGTFLVSEENLVDLGGKVFLYGFYLSVLKAGGESLFETLLSFTIGLIYKAIHRAEGTLVNQGFVSRTVAGQALVGAAAASVVAVVAPAANWCSTFLGASLGFLVGYPLSILTLVVNLFLERKVIPGGPRKVSPVRTLGKLLYALITGLVVGLLAATVAPLRAVIGTVVCITATQALTMKLILIDQRPGVDPFDPECVDHGIWDSPTFTALSSWHFLPGLVGVPVGSLAGGYVGEWIAGGYTNVVALVFAALPFGMFAGCIAALTVNQMLESYPQLLGSFVGVGTFAAAGLWSPVFAVVIGTLVGAAVGSVLEIRMAEQRIQDELQKLHEEAVERAREAELREKKGLEPILDEFSTEEEVNREHSPRTRTERLQAAQERALQGLPIANGLACETIGNELMLPSGERGRLSLTLKSMDRCSSMSSLMRCDLSPLANRPRTPESQMGHQGDRLREVGRGMDKAQAFTIDRCGNIFEGLGHPELQQQWDRTEATLCPQLSLSSGESGDLDTHELLALPPAEPEAGALDIYEPPAPPPAAPTTVTSGVPLPMTAASIAAGSVQGTPQAIAPAVVLGSPQAAAIPASLARSPLNQQTHRSASSAEGCAGRANPKTLALVENLNLERSDETPEELEAAAAREKERAAKRLGPSMYLPQEDAAAADEELFGRWDRSAPARRGRSEPRRVQRAVPKPSLWAHRQAGPPPTQTPSFRNDQRRSGK